MDIASSCSCHDCELVVWSLLKRMRDEEALFCVRRCDETFMTKSFRGCGNARVSRNCDASGDYRQHGSRQKRVKSSR